MKQWSSAARRGAQARWLRIVGGRWRGRRLRFPPGPIRPTPDRVRETLFNWLQGPIQNSRCLDLFAGSGALGLEALSRGAASVLFVDRDRAAIEALRELLQAWQATGAELRQDTAERLLAHGPPAPFDIVFLDPPFDGGQLGPIAEALEQHGWLHPMSLIYLEHAARAPLPALPACWQMRRSGSAGQVRYHLVERSTRLSQESGS